MHHMGERTRRALAASLKDALDLAGRYALFARLAGEAGLGPVEEELAACARQVLTHAAIWLRRLRGGEAPSAAEMLEEALRSERALWSDALCARERDARKEGQDEVADLLQRIKAISRAREERLQALYEEVRAGELYDRREPVVWVCLRCGWEHLSSRAPEFCPLCGCGREGIRQRHGQDRV